MYRENAAYNHLINEIHEVADYLWLKGWAERNSGNISIYLTDLVSDDLAKIKKENLSEQSGINHPIFSLQESFPSLADSVFYITGSGCRMRDIHKDPDHNRLIIKVLKDGNGYQVLSHDKNQLQKLRPTSELSAHLAMHAYLREHKPDKRCVLHAHPADLIALTHIAKYNNEETLNQVLWGMLPETVVLIPEGVGLIPYKLTGSMPLAEASVQGLKNHNVLIWEKHGCVVASHSPLEALDLMDVTSKSAGILLKCLAAGHEPEGISPAQLAELRAHFHGNTH
jgi:rhamnulose-1-phosphate aldolase